MMKGVETARVKNQNKTVVGLPKFEDLKLDKKRDRVRLQLSKSITNSKAMKTERERSMQAERERSPSDEYLD